MIERGCVDGNRERYDAAWKAFVKHSSTPLPEPWIPAYLLENVFEKIKRQPERCVVAAGSRDLRGRYGG